MISFSSYSLFSSKEAPEESTGSAKQTRKLTLEPGYSRLYCWLKLESTYDYSLLCSLLNSAPNSSHNEVFARGHPWYEYVRLCDIRAITPSLISPGMYRDWVEKKKQNQQNSERWATYQFSQPHSPQWWGCTGPCPGPSGNGKPHLPKHSWKTKSGKVKKKKKKVVVYFAGTLEITKKV